MPRADGFAYRSPTPFCVERHRAELRDLVANHVDVLFANEDEAMSLYEVGRLRHGARRSAGGLRHRRAYPQR